VAGRLLMQRVVLWPRPGSSFGIQIQDPDASTETDARESPVDSLFTDQEVALWVNGTTVKTKLGQATCAS